MEQSTKPSVKPEEDKDERAKRKARVYSRYVLPSNRHSFQVQFDVLKRIVNQRRSSGISASQIEGEGIPAQAASMNVRFLRDIGLITPSDRGLYVPTQEAIQFINAKSVSDDKARPILAALIVKTWFAEIATSVFSNEPIMSEDKFLGELAIAAQTDKIKEQLALRTLLEYLIYTGIIVRDERGLSFGGQSKTSTPYQPTELSENVSPIDVPLTEKSSEKQSQENLGWHIIQTEDFYVKVKSDIDIVDDLILYLQTLQKKISRLKGAAKKDS
ncbi:MAG: hypothetical protein NT131_04700 [Methanomassiliicoccales archaeon]|nr:hypothetical protein [Methanomassiliicoccales archaeon]